MKQISTRYRGHITMISKKIVSMSASRWALQKAKLKTRFPKLTDADLNFNEIQKGIMFSKLEFKLAITAEELQVIIEKL